jgi:superfamily II DNA or RNA helicase
VDFPWVTEDPDRIPHFRVLRQSRSVETAGVSQVELNEAFLAKAAGWEVMKQARSLLAAGRVLSSNWTPPILKGVVQSDTSSLRAGLSIRHALDIDNMCSCRPSREWGTLCAHSVAVGLHHLKVPAVDDEPTATSSRKPSATPDSRPSSPRPSPPTKDPVRLRRSETGAPLEISVIFPPNPAESFARGRVMLVFEGVTRQGRTPLNALVRSGPWRLSAEDSRLLDAAETACGGDTPGMVQLDADSVTSLLPGLAGHPRVSLGRGRTLSISSTPAALPLQASLESDGQILLRLPLAPGSSTVLAGKESTWLLAGDRLQPLALGAEFREVLQRPIRIPRNRVPTFLGQDWPKLAVAGGLESTFTPSEFHLEPAPPRFLLNLAGGLAQLNATLQCAYGARIMTVGVTRADEAAWIPDPGNIRRYSTRDLGAEHAAFMRLRAAGFTGPDSQGRWQVVGQDRVLAYFARAHPKLEREWTVSLEERLEFSTRKNLERVTPQFRISAGSGERWFDLEVTYETTDGERFSAADIQRLVLGGGTGKTRSGKTVVFDTGAVEELQEVLLDCAPDQRDGRYRIDAAQAGFLDASLREQGHAPEAPAAWRNRVAQQTGEAIVTCPPLGTLEEVLRPYQKHGVGWMRFLRENGFGGVLADEMGLGKTLQVLAHLSSPGRIPAGPARPSLVVCPTSLVHNWAAEAARFTPGLRVLVLSGPQRHREFGKIPGHDLVLTSYALIRRDSDHYREHRFDTVVLDEAQHIKNRDTQNAKAVKSIRADHRLVLSGTPLENSVLDLWSLFDFLMPGYLGSADDFRDRYEVPITKERDKASMARLGKRIRPFLLRRLKRDVVKELPAKLEQVSYCDLTPSQAEVYAQVLAATRRQVDDAVGAQGLAKSRMVILTALLRLRQVCCDLRLLEAKDAESPSKKSPEESGKFQMFGELLDEILDGGHRVLVFSQFTRMLGLLREELERREVSYCYLDGSTQDRAGEVRKFQEDSGPPVFLISLKAGGVGLNLTGADTVVHFDPWWNPAVEDQATDRAHRIGQTRVVSSYKLITRGTVEEKILTLQQRKRDIIGATLTGEEAFTESLSWEEIRELLG